MTIPFIEITHWPRPLTMRLLLLGMFLLVLLSGCGFYLRGRLTLPPEVAGVRVVSSTPYSALAKMVRQMIRASRITVIEDGVAAGKVSSVGLLNIVAERWGDLAISVDRSGRALEYSVRYATIFTLVDANNKVIVPQQSIELSRDYVSPPTDATGTATEREILANELRREMAASILRRIDSVVRHRLQTTGTLSVVPVPPPPAAAAPDNQQPGNAMQVQTPPSAQPVVPDTPVVR